MGSPVDRPKWKTVEYSRNQIIKAGKIIRKSNDCDEEYNAAIKIVDNWRASHAYPLHVIYMNLRRMKGSKQNIVVAERLKRLDSITKKLSREPNMSLWTMQDLGGCRVIVPEIDDVYTFANKYESSYIRHIKQKEYDYIKEPKADGYRSLHVVYEYHSDKKDTYNNKMLIEIQFRTRLQHLWATAVETMGLFTKEAIKSGQGSPDVRRFFALVSSLFALEENKPIIPGTPTDKDELIHEIEAINATENILDILAGIRVAIKHQKNIKTPKKPGYTILILNYQTKMLTMKNFKINQFEEANRIYSQIESTRAESMVDAVLVRVTSFNDLKKAYPNYFSDIGEFIDKVKSYLS